MNPQLKTHDSLRKAILADRPSVTIGQCVAHLHFSEEQYLMQSHPTRLLMIEYKSTAILQLEQVPHLVNAVKEEIRSRYSIQLYVRQVAFNRSNIVTMYTMIKRSPKPKRKATVAISSSGVSSDSESVTDTSDRDGKSVPKPIAFTPASSTRQSGELDLQQFNGSSHLTPILRTSTSQQTEREYIVEEAHPSTAPQNQDPAEVYASFEERKNMNQILTTATFTKVRRYLAYFINNKDTVLDGESYLDLRIRIHNDGLIGDDSDVERIYYKALNTRGLTDFQIKSDLQTLGHNLQARKVKEMNASRIAFEQYYTGRVRMQLRPPIQPPPGKFDPELCVIT